MLDGASHAVVRIPQEALPNGLGLRVGLRHQHPELIPKVLGPRREPRRLRRVDIHLLQLAGEVHQRPQVNIGVAVARRPDHAFWATPPRKPNGRMRLLHR